MSINPFRSILHGAASSSLVVVVISSHLKDVSGRNGGSNGGGPTTEARDLTTDPDPSSPDRNGPASTTGTNHNRTHNEWNAGRTTLAREERQST